MKSLLIGLLLLILLVYGCEPQPQKIYFLKKYSLLEGDWVLTLTDYDREEKRWEIKDKNTLLKLQDSLFVMSGDKCHGQETTDGLLIQLVKEN